MNIYTLYSTDGCHLCDLAIGVIGQIIPSKFSADVYLEDIAESEQLVERYGVRIPVLKHDASGMELNWPFDGESLLKWLSSTGKSLSDGDE